MMIGAEPVEQFLTASLFATLDDPKFRSYMSKGAGSRIAKVVQEIGETEGEMAELEDAASSIPVKAYVAKASALDETLTELRRELASIMDDGSALTWIASRERVRKTWPDKPLSEQRTIILDILGTFTVTKAQGKRPLTPDVLRQRLTPETGRRLRL